MTLGKEGVLLGIPKMRSTCLACLSSLNYLDILEDNVGKGGVQQRSRFLHGKGNPTLLRNIFKPLVIPPIYEQRCQRNVSGVIQDAFPSRSQLAGVSEDCP